MAGMKRLDVYLALERLMIELDGEANPIADQIRDLMDPLWNQLSAEEVARLDSRGQIDPVGLFPVKMPVPESPRLQTPTVADQRFERAGWQAPADWRKQAA